MRRIQALIVLLFSILVFISCGKDHNPDNSNPPVPDTNDSTYLDSIYIIGNPGSFLDTGNIVIYHYDNLKRLASTSNLRETAPASSVYIDGGSSTFYYNGNDTLPYKLVAYSNSDINNYVDTSTSFYNYDANGNKIKDSTRFSSSDITTYTLKTTVTDYTYSAGKMVGYTVENDVYPNTNQVVSKDTATLDSKGNVITNVKYIVTGATENLALTSTGTYDNHPGPYTKITAFKAMRQFAESDNVLYLSYNNYLTIDHNQLLPSIETIHSSATYQYLANGYPVIADIIYDGVSYSYAYTYKSLP